LFNLPSRLQEILTLSLIEKIAAGPEQNFTDAIPTKAVKFIGLSTDRRKTTINQSITLP
jgi:hypothetical protein